MQYLTMSKLRKKKYNLVTIKFTYRFAFNSKLPDMNLAAFGVEQSTIPGHVYTDYSYNCSALKTFDICTFVNKLKFNICKIKCAAFMSLLSMF